MEILEKDILAPASGFGEAELTAFMSLRGLAYDGALMVVGRAVNGWLDGISSRKLADATLRHSHANALYASSSRTATCPMGWVDEQWSGGEAYNTGRSAFWRVCRRVLERVELAPASAGFAWSSRLVWSNLYKLAPARGGNPAERLKKAQFEGCLKLLRLEIDQYKPRRILFLTGLDWAHPFLTGMNLENRSSHVLASSGLVEAVGTLHSTNSHAACVVAKHPMGKNEELWVREVLEAFAAECI